MARLKSAAAQAIKDMLAANMDISMFIGVMRQIHSLNDEVGITERYTRNKPTVKVKVEIELKWDYQVPEALKPLPRKKWVINPDGTIALFEREEWDFC